MLLAVKNLGLLACAALLSCLAASAQLRPETSEPEKKPAVKPARIVVETAPGAQVYLDDEFKGQANSAGRLVIPNPKLGEHTLRVTLMGKKDYEQTLTVAAGKETAVNATLEEPVRPPQPQPARIIVETLPYAEVYLDDERQGQTSGAGRLVIPNPKTGERTLRVTLAGKKDYEQKVTVVAGKDATVKATLAEAEQPAPPQLAPRVETLRPAAAVTAGTTRENHLKGRVSVQGLRSAENIAVYLDAIAGVDFPAPAQHVTIDQKQMKFVPHVTVVQKGTTVEFLNSDPVGHNVYWPSISGNKKLAHNLGTWPKGMKVPFQFNDLGAASLFCNVHPEMSGYVVVVPTPYFAVTDKDGNFVIKDVPTGHYTLRTWSEEGKPVTQAVDVTAAGANVLLTVSN